MSFSLTSDSFENGGVIPQKFGYKHGNHSPSLTIQNIPEGTQSMVLIMDDPDAMGAVGKVWVHWVVWNIDPISQIKEDSLPDGCMEGETDFGETGYGGPAPPDKEHTYVFKLYALSERIQAKKGSTKRQIEEIMKGVIIEETVLMGRYSPQ